VSVGGTGVFVGIAAWVWATMVNAAETAVAWTSSGLKVGSAGALLHALAIKNTVRVSKKKILFIVDMYSKSLNNWDNNCPRQGLCHFG
jgi:hypothetical protein